MITVCVFIHPWLDRSLVLAKIETMQTFRTKVQTQTDYYLYQKSLCRHDKNGFAITLNDKKLLLLKSVWKSSMFMWYSKETPYDYLEILDVIFERRRF